MFSLRTKHTCRDQEAKHAGGAGPPLLLLHSFDSSLLEFRRLFPRLAAAGAETWAVDLAGACSHNIQRGGAAGARTARGRP